MSDAEEKSGEGSPLLVKRHVKYFQRILNVLPQAVASMDTSRYGCADEDIIPIITVHFYTYMHMYICV